MDTKSPKLSSQQFDPQNGDTSEEDHLTLAITKTIVIT